MKNFMQKLLGDKAGASAAEYALILAVFGGAVVIGRDQPQQRLARFIAVMPMLLQGRTGSFVYADLRYSNGFAVKWPVAAAPVAPSSGPNASAKTHAPARDV